MLTIEAITCDLAGLPGLVKVGLVLMLLSGLGDVVVHLGAPVAAATSGGHELTGSEAWAHLGGFVSMVVIFAGVLIDGVRRSRARHIAAAHQQKGVA